MKIYAADDSKYNEFEQFAGKDVWVAVTFYNATFGMNYVVYVNIIDMYTKKTTFRYARDEYVTGNTAYPEVLDEPEMITINTDDFLDKFEIVQPVMLITTTDMEEILEIKLTHIEDWYSK